MASETKGIDTGGTDKSRSSESRLETINCKTVFYPQGTTWQKLQTLQMWDSTEWILYKELLESDEKIRKTKQESAS